MGSKRKLGQARRQWKQTVAPAERALLATTAFTAGVRLFPSLYASPAAQAAHRIVGLWNENHRIIYTVDADLQKEITRTGLPTEKIPGEVFDRLPHPAPMFVLTNPIAVSEPETSSTLLYEMFVVASTRDYVIDHATGKFLLEPQPLLRFVWFGHSTANPDEFVFSTSSVHLGGDVDLNYALANILTDVPAEAGEAAEISKQIRGENWDELNSKLFPIASMLIVYACSQDPDLQPVSPPEALRREHSNRRNSYQLHNLGFRIGAAIRSARKPTSTGGGSETTRTVAPHVRKAHWHRFWTGPRKDPTQRKLIIRWIPPVPINIDKGEPKSTVYPLRDKKDVRPIGKLGAH